MSEVKWHREALDDLDRLHAFLKGKDADAAQRAAAAILEATTMLGDLPRLGRPTNDRTERFELVVRFGSAGYVVSYRMALDGTVVILSVWHTRESWH